MALSHSFGMTMVDVSMNSEQMILNIPDRTRVVPVSTEKEDLMNYARLNTDSASIVVPGADRWASSPIHLFILTIWSKFSGSFAGF